jgi:hypothetical protein
MNIASKIAAVTIVLGISTAAYFAYFVRSENVTQGRAWDGFGRELSAPPEWATVFLDGLVWKGIGWHLGDMLLFTLGLILAIRLFCGRRGVRLENC